MTDKDPAESFCAYWFLAFGGILAMGVFTAAILAVAISSCKIS
jgi:hypothetical protein